MVAHGATGKGNDQVRFEVSFAALAPALQPIAPAREWGMTREQEIEYAHANSIPIPVNVDSPYSIDVNIWGRSIECGILEDPTQEPPEEVFEWTTSPLKAPDTPSTESAAKTASAELTCSKTASSASSPARSMRLPPPPSSSAPMPPSNQ
jgi:argininosuccinate synthase